MNVLATRSLIAGLAVLCVACGGNGLTAGTASNLNGNDPRHHSGPGASGTPGSSSGPSATGGATATPGQGTTLTSSGSAAPTHRPTGTPTPHPTAHPTLPPGPSDGFTCGTWPMIEVNTASALNKFSTWVNDGLSVPGVAGFSIRAPWTSITSNLDIYNTAFQMAQAHHVGLAIRFGGGIHTPAQFLGNSTILKAAGQPIPLPWGSGATATHFVPNSAFEAGFTATLRELVAWSRAHNVHEIHLPWYSGLSNEIYEGPEVANAPGFSLQNFFTGYERLIDIAMSLTGPDITVEFPMGGIWLSPVDHTLRQYMVDHYGAGNPRIIVQWNALEDNSPTVSGTGVNIGRQMHYPIDYNWASVYQTLLAEGSETVEVWVQSFAPTLPHAALLRQEVAMFATRC